MGKNKSSNQKEKNTGAIPKRKKVDDNFNEWFSAIEDMINLLWCPKEKKQLLSRMNQVLGKVYLKDVVRVVLRYQKCVKNLFFIEKHLTVKIAKSMIQIEHYVPTLNMSVYYLVMAETVIARTFMNIVSENDIFNFELKQIKNDINYDYVFHSNSFMYPEQKINQEYLTVVEMIKRLYLVIPNFNFQPVRLKGFKSTNNKGNLTSEVKTLGNKSIDAESLKVKHSTFKSTEFKPTEISQDKSENLNLRPATVEQLENEPVLTPGTIIEGNVIKHINLQSNVEHKSSVAIVPKDACKNYKVNDHEIAAGLEMSEDELNQQWVIDFLIRQLRRMFSEQTISSSNKTEDVKEYSGSLTKLDSVKQVKENHPVCKNEENVYDSRSDNSTFSTKTSDSIKNTLGNDKVDYLIENKFTTDYFERLENESKDIHEKACRLDEDLKNEEPREECFAVKINYLCGYFQSKNICGYLKTRLGNGTVECYTLKNSNLEIDCLKCEKFLVDKLASEDLVYLCKEMDVFLECNIQGVVFKVKNLKGTTLTLTDVCGCFLKINDNVNSEFLCLNDANVEIVFANGDFFKVNVSSDSILKIIKDDENTNIFNEKKEIRYVENSNQMEKDESMHFTKTTTVITSGNDHNLPAPDEILSSQSSAGDLKEALISQGKDCEKACKDIKSFDSNSNKLHQTNNKPKMPFSVLDVGISRINRKYRRAVINPDKYKKIEASCSGTTIDQQNKKKDREQDEYFVKESQIHLTQVHPRYLQLVKLCLTRSNDLGRNYFLMIIFEESLRTEKDDDTFNDSLNQPTLSSFYPKNTIDYIKNNLDEIMKITAYRCFCQENNLFTRGKNTRNSQLPHISKISMELNALCNNKKPLQEIYAYVAKYLNLRINPLNSCDSTFDSSKVNWCLYAVRLIGTLRVILQQLIIREILHSLGFETLSQEKIYKDSMKDLKKESTGLDVEIFKFYHDADKRNVKKVFRKWVKWENGNFIHLGLV